MDGTIETTLQEFTINDNSIVLVMVQEIDELPFFSVRWLVTRKFGFKTFFSRIHAGNFFNEIKSGIVLQDIQSSIVDKLNGTLNRPS
jgi:hypothetical protein